jgi:hypothetical protein
MTRSVATAETPTDVAIEAMDPLSMAQTCSSLAAPASCGILPHEYITAINLLKPRQKLPPSDPPRGAA